MDTGEQDIWLENEGVVGNLRVLSNVPQWFKVALQDIEAKQSVIKFGYTIGIAFVKIRRGTIVHRGNVVFENQEDVITNSRIIKNQLEIGISLRCIMENKAIEIDKDAIIYEAVADDIKDKPFSASTIIPSQNVLYCGNMMDQPISEWMIGPEQLEEIEQRLKASIKQMDGDTKRYLELLYPHIKSYNLLRMQLFLREISERKGH